MNFWAATETIIPSASARTLQFIRKDFQITGKAHWILIHRGSIAELNMVTEKECTVDLLTKLSGKPPLRVI